MQVRRRAWVEWPGHVAPLRLLRVARVRLVRCRTGVSRRSVRSRASNPGRPLRAGQRAAALGRNASGTEPGKRDGSQDAASGACRRCRAAVVHRRSTGRALAHLRRRHASPRRHASMCGITIQRCSKRSTRIAPLKTSIRTRCSRGSWLEPPAQRRPRSTMTSCSASSASDKSCRTLTTVTPVATCRRSNCASAIWCGGSRCVVGSSSRSSGASTAIARARKTRWRSPPESSCRRRLLPGEALGVGHDLIDARFVRGARRAEQALAREPAEAHDFAYRQLAGCFALLRQPRQSRRALAARERAQRHAVEQHLAAVGRQQSGHDAQQGRLAGAVRADDRGPSGARRRA